MKITWFVLGCAFLFVADGRTLSKSPEGFGFLCSKSTPCGWEVYKPYDRTPEYFMDSPCECPPNTKCVQSEDDISISAYVYRCTPQS